MKNVGCDFPALEALIKSTMWMSIPEGCTKIWSILSNDKVWTLCAVPIANNIISFSVNCQKDREFNGFHFSASCKTTSVFQVLEYLGTEGLSRKIPLKKRDNKASLVSEFNKINEIAERTVLRVPYEAPFSNQSVKKKEHG